MPRLVLFLELMGPRTSGATQFMALFGKMVDKTPVPQAIDPEKPLSIGGRRRLLHQRRQEEAQEKSEASGFSDAFAWWGCWVLQVCASLGLI